MTTISRFITDLREKSTTDVEVKYLHPTLYVICTSDEFEGLDATGREKIIAENVELSDDDLKTVRRAGALELVLSTAHERTHEFGFLDEAEEDQSWLSWFDPQNWARHTEPPILTSERRREDYDPIRTIHFYGYKGGQARSTVLVMLAKYLATIGFRVLIVDADVEAPSVDMMLDVATENLNSTLMGACGWGTEIFPISEAYIGKEGGKIDVIACRPKSSAFDMDFAAFLLNIGMDVRTLKKAARSIRSFAASGPDNLPRYDVLLIDHRTGMAPSVLPIMEELPGSAAIFVRPDSSSKNIENSKLFDALLSYDVDTPGVFVSFSLDPVETLLTAKGVKGAFIERLLESIADAYERNGGDIVDPSELDRNWVLWHHDRALLSDRMPEPDSLSKDNLSSLQQLKEVLGIDFRVRAALPEKNLTRSGATDEGWFIRTPDVSRLFSLDNKLLYIFGRKGTGKTRLVRELSNAHLGEPLLVASDYDKAGVASLGPAFTRLLKISNNNFEVFWWLLLRIGVESKSMGLAEINHMIDQFEELGRDSVLECTTPSEIEKLVSESGRKRVFLIDGVETAVPAADLRRFVESLFRFMASVQYNQKISDKLTVRLFLRSDLSTGAVQNVEQQIEGRVIYLRWDKTSILNFALGRIASLSWYRSTFPTVCSRIDELASAIEKGSVPDEQTEQLLLEIFPSSLERNRLKTTTFFSTYFSDAGSETDEKASFYPRLFDVFLRKIVEFADQEYKEKTLLDGKLLSGLVLKAYDIATESFINEVRTELYNLLTLDPVDDKNRSMVDRLINSFSDEPTPFVVERMVETLSSKVKLPQERIREALDDMKAIGMFENRPGYHGSWRTGRVYKAGLKMKYVRSPRSPN
ncbi:AAA family ATPase [Pseudoduganella sp. SL102]|uniref:AAA family ATPase n=1 Tax=Pseudoduganella sp. SL102 TaxID=2995154 RepID=UPI00248C9B4B|nr:AAA family ATPase [Pseudoduganella sp. SL102]WBS03375.1 AAA family ATPase [Pseudoduganella sp. SL102]